jgi:dUTP pyrophosphatase
MASCKLFFKKTDNRAVIPKKAYDTDTGLDLVAIDVFKRLENGVIMLETGIAVKPPSGYYTEILPRSSIIKTGFILANSVGIIDSSFRNSLKIAIIPVYENTVFNFEDIKNKFQLVIRKIEDFEVEEVDDLDITERGMGGFGSTNHASLI